MHTTRWLFLGITLISIGAVFFSFNTAHRTRVLTTDSIIYVDTARHIASGQGPVTSILKTTDTISPTPQTQWPPLYPMTMAPFIHFGVDPIQAGRLVSGIAFGLTVLLVGLWVWRLAGPFAGLTAAAALTAMPSVTAVAAAVWTDSLYTLIVTGLAWLGTSLIRRPQRRLAWFAFGSLVGLAIVDKYLGILLLGFVVLTIILSLRSDRRWWSALSRLGFTLLGVAVFVGPLLTYNLINGRPIGGAGRTLSTQNLGEILRDLWNTVSHDTTASALWIGILILMAVALLDLGRRKKLSDLGSILPIGGYMFIYWLGLVAARLLIDTDRVYSRFTMPVYPLFVVIAVVIIAAALKQYGRTIVSAGLILIFIAATTWSTKEYDFGIESFAANPSARTKLIAELTTDRDLIVGPGAREYNLFLGRSVIHISDDVGTPRLSPELISSIAYTWSNRVDRAWLALPRDIDASEYGQFAADLSHHTYESWTPAYINDTLILYVITGR